MLNTKKPKEEEVKSRCISGKTKTLLTHIVLATMLALTSCTIEKRVYMPGYHMEWLNGKNNPNKNELAGRDNSKKINENKIVPDNQTAQPAINSNTTDKTVTASADNLIVLAPTNSFLAIEKLTIKNINHLRKKLYFKLVKSAEDCDIIILKDGQELKAKVLEIGPNEIKYKMCDNLTGPTLSKNKSEVFMIKYPNGTKDIIASGSSGDSGKKDIIKSASSTVSKYNGPKKLNVRALISMICGILAFIFLFSFFVFALEAAIAFEAAVVVVLFALASAILAIVFGSVALKQFKSDPEK